MNTRYDVVVVGGGTAGVIAATQAARFGARTLLVERNTILGGTVTAGGIAFPGLFHAWGRQIVAGIGWELVAKAAELSGTVLPDFTQIPERHWLHQVRLSAPIYAALCDETLTDAGADILFATMPVSIEPNAGAWTIDLCSRNGNTAISTKTIVDCSGDAVAAAMCGVELNRSAEKQPATLSFKLSGYDTSTLDFAALDAAAEEAVQKGELRYNDLSWNATAASTRSMLNSGGSNCNHIVLGDASDVLERSNLELEGRRAFLRAFRFLRKQPGLEDLKVDHICSECGVRETVTIKGKTEISVGDYLSGRLWPDAVCYSYYPIDLHDHSASGIEQRHFTEGTVATIPRGAMLPEDVDNLVVAGRCVSGDRLSNSAYRTQATCMATGQAAGAMAALAGKRGVTTSALDLEDLLDALESQGAIVPR